MLQSALGRVLLTGLGLALSTLLFRFQIADALIVRGDEMLVRNAYDAAASKYMGALRLDGGSSVAIDRLVFIALQRRTPAAFRAASVLASQYLATNSAEQTVLFDRALCYLKLKQFHRAYKDFSRAASLSGDPQQYTFAGWAARRAGDWREAAALWKRALRIRPNYRPASDALAEIR